MVQCEQPEGGHHLSRGIGLVLHALLMIKCTKSWGISSWGHVVLTVCNRQQLACFVWRCPFLPSGSAHSLPCALHGIPVQQSPLFASRLEFRLRLTEPTIQPLTYLNFLALQEPLRARPPTGRPLPAPPHLPAPPGLPAAPASPAGHPLLAAAPPAGQHLPRSFLPPVGPAFLRHECQREHARGGRPPQRAAACEQGAAAGQGEWPAGEHAAEQEHALAAGC